MTQAINSIQTNTPRMAIANGAMAMPRVSPSMAIDIRPNYTAKELEEILGGVNTSIILRVGAINACASFMMVDAVKELKQNTPLYKQYVKKKCNEALRLYDEWEGKVKGTYQEGKFNVWLTVSDNMYESLQQPMQQFQQAVWNKLTRANVKHAREIAYMLCADTMLQYACVSYENICECIRKQVGFKVAPMFKEWKINQVYEAWGEAANHLARNSNGKSVNLNEDRDCMLAFKVIDNIAMSDDIFLDASTDAILTSDEIREEDKALTKEAHERVKREKEEELAERKRKIAQTQKSFMRKRASDISKEDLEMLKSKFNTK